MHYPLLDAFWTMLLFFLWIMWLFLLFRVVLDIFRNHQTSGWSKAGWLIVVIVLPYLGVFFYVIIHGTDMGQRDLARAEHQQQVFHDHVRQAAAPSGGASHADQLSRLADLKDRGAITDTEFQQAKAKILA
jgi:Short C-terminal domain/Phospholipase_D-nuclease N-terminal